MLPEQIGCKRKFLLVFGAGPGWGLSLGAQAPRLRLRFQRNLRSGTVICR